MVNLSAHLVILSCLLTCHVITGQLSRAEGYRLTSTSKYFAVAPKRVRPGQVYECHITLYEMITDQTDVRVTLSNDGEEYAGGMITFTQLGTRNLQLLVPDTTRNGSHKLAIEGLLGSPSAGMQMGQPIFRNETALSFDSKRISLFIQTDKPLYRPEQTVRYRIVGVKPKTLKPAYGDMTIFLRDGGGHLVRRWMGHQLNFGMYSSSFDIPYPVETGTWSIVVEAFGSTYEKDFLVEFWYRRRFEVNVTSPFYMLDTEWGLIGTVFAQHLSNIYTKGNGTISVRLREGEDQFLEGEIRKEITYLDGPTPFEVTMLELNREWGEGSVAGKEIYIQAWLFDWKWEETLSGFSITQVIHDQVDVKLLGRRLRTFKPRTPTSLQYAVVRAGGAPYSGVNQRVIKSQTRHERDGRNTLVEPEKFHVIPDDGVVQVDVMPTVDDTRIIVTAWHDSNPGDPLEVEMYRHHSRLNKFMSVTTSTKEARVNEYMVFTLRTNFFADEVNYVIAAGGDILLGSSIDMTTHQKTFSVAVSRSMAPVARIVAYVMIEDEFLTDSLIFFVKDTTLTQASLTLNYGKNFRQDTIELIGRGAAGGFIGVNGYDYEPYSRGANLFLNEEWIIEELMTYDDANEAPLQQVWWLEGDQWEKSMFFNTPSSGIDMLSTFELSGLVALSDTNLTVTEESHNCNKTLGFGRCLNGDCYDLSSKCDDFVNCLDGTDEMGCPLREKAARRPHTLHQMQKIKRHFSNNDWLWKTSYVKPNGQIELSLVVPESDDTVVIGAFILHPESGLAIVSEIAQHDCSRRFYMVAEAPSVIKRGEQIGIRLALFNNWDQNMETIVTMHGGDDYRFISVPQSGLMSSYRPTLLAGDVQTMVELRAGEWRYIYMPVVSLIAPGEFTVTITAHSFINTDVENVHFEVAFDGVENDNFIPYLLDLVNQGSKTTPVFDISIPEQFWVPDERWLNYLPGSNWAEVVIWADVVSPGFFEDHLNCDNTVGAPHDAAEGYMYEFAVNLITLRYLHKTNTLTTEATNNAVEYMNSIIMRQYAYMQSNGSVKQFRRTEKPCVWLTSFVLRWLHSALASDWSKDLYVDPPILNQMALWLTYQQHPDGYFVETSDHIYDRVMRPESRSEDGDKMWHIAVTAHVVITFAGCTRLSGEAKMKMDAAKMVAADYLAGLIQDVSELDPHQMAMLAYALKVSQHRAKEDAYHRLKSMARVNTDGQYWSEVEMDPNAEEIVQTLRYMQAREQYTHLAGAMTASSYALMLYLQHNELEAAVPIMKWISVARYGPMAFSGVQDTILGLEALTDFALRETNRDFYQMQVKLTAPGHKHFQETIMINKSNFAQMHSFELQNAWGEIRMYAEGTGYAFIGMTEVYNTDKHWLVDSPDFDAYYFEIDQMLFLGRNASIMDMRACISWMRTDIAPISGMMTLQMELPTGHIVGRDAIEDMYASGVPGLKRVRFRDQTLILFFEYLEAKRTCFDFRAHRWYPVANVSIAHVVNSFEYAEIGIQNNTQYEAATLFFLHICQVCGSFQCPYCLDYNAAPYIVVSWVTHFAIVAIGMILLNIKEWS